MTNYLVQTRYEDEITVRFFQEPEELTKFLSDNHERGHYYGDAETIQGIYLYVQADGQTPAALQELVIHFEGKTSDEDDYLDYTFALHEKADSEGFGFLPENKVLGYSVRIDGRA